MVVLVMKMNNNSIFPTILDCGYFKLDGNASDFGSARIVTDYEIDFNLSENRTMILDGKKYLLQPNTVIFRKPGQKLQSSMNFNIYMLTLQLDGRKTPQKNIRQVEDLELQSTAKGDFFSVLPPVFVPMHYNEIRNDYIKIIRNHAIPDQRKKCEAILEHLLHLLFADAISEKIGKSVIDSTVSEKAITFMEANFQNSNLLLKDIAQTVNMSESYFVRIFKAETGYTPKDFLNTIRIQQAKWYILHTNNPIYTISYQCGFENPQYFIAKFKSYFGKTPQAYRKSEAANKITE